MKEGKKTTEKMNAKTKESLLEVSLILQGRRKDKDVCFIFFKLFLLQIGGKF